MISSEQSQETAPQPAKESWPFFSTPLRVFAGVMVPIAGMMLLLTFLPAVHGGIRLSAGLVVMVSMVSFYKGYACRVVLTQEGVRYWSPGRSWILSWADIKHVGRYIPLDRNRATQYVYMTRLDTPPVDWREIDANTIQLQDRPGLLEAIRCHWDQHGHE